MPRGVDLPYAKRFAVARTYAKWLACGLPRVRTRGASALAMTQRAHALPASTVWHCWREFRDGRKLRRALERMRFNGSLLRSA